MVCVLAATTPANVVSLKLGELMMVMKLLAIENLASSLASAEVLHFPDLSTIQKGEREPLRSASTKTPSSVQEVLSLSS